MSQLNDMSFTLKISLNTASKIEVNYLCTIGHKEVLTSASTLSLKEKAHARQSICPHVNAVPITVVQKSATWLFRYNYVSEIIEKCITVNVINFVGHCLATKSLLGKINYQLYGSAWVIIYSITLC